MSTKIRPLSVVSTLQGILAANETTVDRERTSESGRVGA
jgi:hypothetical protein